MEEARADGDEAGGRKHKQRKEVKAEAEEAGEKKQRQKGEEAEAEEAGEKKQRQKGKEAEAEEARDKKLGPSASASSLLLPLLLPLLPLLPRFCLLGRRGEEAEAETEEAGGKK